MYGRENPGKREAGMEPRSENKEAALLLNLGAKAPGKIDSTLPRLAVVTLIVILAAVSSLLFAGTHSLWWIAVDRNPRRFDSLTASSATNLLQSRDAPPYHAPPSTVRLVNTEAYDLRLRESAVSTIDVPRESPICVLGRALPRLFLLGTQKCGTTSVAHDLMTLGFKSAGKQNQKEIHHFDGMCGFDTWYAQKK